MNFPRKPIIWRSKFLKGIEVTSLFCGAACFIYYASISFELYASKEAAAIYGVVGQPIGLVQAAEVSSVTTNRSDVIGTVSIPQLGLMAPITSDINEIELIRGVGHIPGTAFAGGLGTMGLAGHRDTFFRGLKRVKPKMQIFVAGESGRYLYEVESTKVVRPSEVDVLNIQTAPKLVLVTCYPFSFVGAAPQRFIVTAALRSVSGEGR